MRKFLATTALALSLSTTAYAGGHMNAYLGEVEAGDIMASDFIGMYIYTAEFDGETFDEENTFVENERFTYNGEEREWNNIGEVHDIVLSKDGEVKGVLLDIGGFLGLGEKTVAVSMDQIKMVPERDGDGEFFLVVNQSKDQLMEAPEFDRDAMLRDDMAATTETETEASGDNVTVITTNDAAVEAEVEGEARELAAEAEGVEAEVEGEARELAAEAEAVEREVESEAAEMKRTLADLEVDGYERIEPKDLTTEDLTGTRVYSMNEDDIGEIDELIMTTDGQIEQAIIDFGGFLGIGEKQVAVGFDKLSIQRERDGSAMRVYIDATEEDLDAMPRYED